MFSRLLLVSFLFFGYGCSYKEDLVNQLLDEDIKYYRNGNILNRINTLEKLAHIVENSPSYLENKIFLYRDLGDLYYSISQYDKALNNYKKHKELAKDKLHHIKDLAKVSADIDIADTYIKLGQYEKAIKLLKENLVYDTIGIVSRDLKYSLIRAYLKNGDFQQALTLGKQVFNQRNKQRKDTSILDCETYNLLGDIYLYKEKYQKAIEYYNYPLSIAKKQSFTNYDEMFYQFVKLTGATYNDLVSSYFNLGVVFYKMGMYSTSKKYFQNALNSIQNQPYTPKIMVSQVESALAWATLKYNHYIDKNQISLNLLKESINIKDSLYGKNTLAEDYHRLSDYYNTQDMNKEAYKYMKKSYDIFIENRYSDFPLLNSLDKQNYLILKGIPILKLLDIAYQYKIDISKFDTPTTKELIKTTFTDWLNYKGSILDSENMITTLFNNTSDEKLKEKIETLRSKQRYLAIQKQNYPNKYIEIWKQQIKTTEESIDKLVNEISASTKSFSEEQGLQLISYQDIVSNLQEDELYIDYAKSEKSYYLFTVDNKENISFIQISQDDTQKINNLIEAFKKDVITITKESEKKSLTKTQLKLLTQSSKRKLSQLYELLINKPILKQLNDKSSLIVSTDGALRLLPFETLYDTSTQKYMIESKEIKYVPSGKEFVRLHRYSKKEKNYNNDVIVFANPNFESTTMARGGIINFTTSRFWEAIPGTKEEAEFIKTTLTNVEVYQEEKANETILLKVKQPKILHIATHGFFINDITIRNPMLKSGIVLSGANISAEKNRDYGFVTALKLSGLNLKGTDLVVLSACNTGVVDINNTDSLSGLGKAFIQAGAKDVMMSLWSVDDNATKELMVSFYTEIKTKKDKPNYAKALKEAKLKMIKEDVHPFYWGGFILKGL